MKLLFRITVLFIFISVVMFYSCKKTVTVEPIANPSTPLYALLIGDTGLSLFNSAVQKAGDSALFHNIDSITVLMPSNAALLAAGINNSTINSMPAKSLDSLVRLHYIAGPPNLTPGSSATYNSLLGPVLYGYVSADSSRYYFNGIFSMRQTLRGSNAVVFRLNTLLQTGTFSFTQILNADTSLAYFTEALNHSGVNVVPSSGWNTLLAPDNNSFIAAGYPTLASIDAADVSSMAAIVQYHVLPGPYFSNSFIGLTAVAPLVGDSIQLTFDSTVVHFTGVSNTVPVSIIQGDKVVATNIILHKINGLLKY